MENTPSKIAADILNAAMAANKIGINHHSADSIAEAFTTIHAAVHEAAKKDYDASLSSPHIK